MVSRRSILKVSLGVCGCAVCSLGGLISRSSMAEPTQQTDVHGEAYALHFVGAQRDTVMKGQLQSLLDVRSLSGTAHLYGIGPIEHLRGEVTIVNSRPSLARVDASKTLKVDESFETGAPFFVWAEVPSWSPIVMPSDLASYGDLEKFIPEAAARAGLDPRRPLPFLLRGRTDLIEFHVLNRIGDQPHNAERHREIQAVFESRNADVVMIGFYSPTSRGVFTPMDSAIHIHFQTADNTGSGHVQQMTLGGNVTLAFPSV